MSVAEKILELLAWSGMEQKQLAIKSGIPYGTVHGFLKQGRSIPADSILKISDALGVSVYTLLDCEPLLVKPIELTESEQKMIGLYRSLNKQQQDFIAQSLEIFYKQNQEMIR